MNRLLAILAILSAPALAEAKDPWVDDSDPIATKTVKLVVADESPGLSYSLTFHVRAKAWLLLDDPVVYCDTAVELSLFDSYLRPPYDILTREEAAELARIHDVEFTFKVQGSNGDTGYRLRCDPGSLGKSFHPRAGRSSWLRLKKDARRPYVSYNVPGSPKWSRTFTRGGKAVPAEEARRVFRDNLDAEGLLRLRGFLDKDYPDFTIEARVSSADVERRLAELTLERERAALEEAKATWAREDKTRRALLVEQNPKPKRVGGVTVAAQDDPFWGTPEEVTTPKEAKAREEQIARVPSSERRTKKWQKARRDFEARERAARERVPKKSKGVVEGACRRAVDRFDACLIKRCGVFPTPSPLGIMFHQEALCSGSGAQRQACEDKKARDKKLAKARAKELEKQEAIEMRKKQDAWRSCASNARPACLKVGQPDYSTCRKTIDLSAPR